MVGEENLLSQGFLFFQPTRGQAASNTAGSVLAAGMALGAIASLLPLVLLSEGSGMGRTGQPEPLQHLSGPCGVKDAPPQGPKSQEEAELSFNTLPSSKVEQWMGRQSRAPEHSGSVGFATSIPLINSLSSRLHPSGSNQPHLQALSGRQQRSTNQPKRLEACSPPKSKR